MPRRKQIPIPAPVAIPPPKRTMHTAQNSLEEVKTLLNSKYQLEIGDVFYRIEKCTITRILETQGSPNLEVTYKVTKSHWQKEL